MARALGLTTAAVAEAAAVWAVYGLSGVIAPGAVRSEDLPHGFAINELGLLGSA